MDIHFQIFASWFHYYVKHRKKKNKTGHEVGFLFAVDFFPQ